MPLSRRRRAVRFLERSSEKSKSATEAKDSSLLSWRTEDYQYVWQVELEAELTEEDSDGE